MSDSRTRGSSARSNVRRTHARLFPAPRAGKAVLLVLLNAACGGSSHAPTDAAQAVVVPAPSGAVAPHTAKATPAPSCPALAAQAGYPPWHRELVREFCVRDSRGRWRTEADPTDADGWAHWLIFNGAGGAELKLNVTAPVALGLRTDGAPVLVDLKDRVSLFAPTGELLWQTAFPRCGSVRQLAIGYDHSLVFSCGYSLLKFDATGALSFQKWPLGDTSIGGPWVDEQGTIYLSGAGQVAALDPGGELRWKVSAGFNRGIGELVWNQAGNLIFDTSMAELHTDPAATGGLRIYHQRQPNELFELNREGEILKREPYEAEPAGGWPAVLPVPADGGHRVPRR